MNIKADNLRYTIFFSNDFNLLSHDKQPITKIVVFFIIMIFEIYSRKNIKYVTMKKIY